MLSSWNAGEDPRFSLLLLAGVEEGILTEELRATEIRRTVIVNLYCLAG